jgi:signal transduction histidine kinase
VRRASLSVGLYVACATGVVLAIGCACALFYVMHQDVAECVIDEDVRWHNRDPWNQSAVDANADFATWCASLGAHVAYRFNTPTVVTALAILLAIGIALMGPVGWLTARRAVRPLAEALRLQRHFVADASHELRTPLTVLSTRIQLLKRRLAKGEDVGPTVEQLRGDAAGMAEVLNDLLLTVEGSGAAPGVVTPVAATAHQALTSVKVIADQAQVGLRLNVQAQPAVAVPEKSLSRAVVALVDNAIQHSPAGSAVEVIVGQEGAHATIRVRDQGSGIRDADPNRLFERFAHGQEMGKKRSFGLGLALVSEIAQRSKGDIAIETTGPGGTTFVLRLPVSAG